MDIALTIVASIMLLVGFLVVCRSSLGEDEEEYEDEEEEVTNKTPETWFQSSQSKLNLLLAIDNNPQKTCPANNNFLGNFQNKPPNALFAPEWSISLQFWAH